METMNDEKLVIDLYRTINPFRVSFCGNFFRCLRVMVLTKSFLFSKSWIDSSSKNDLPPDFHNDKHRLLMEVMRIDDCINEKDEKHIVNSFERMNKTMKSIAGKNYKKVLNGTLIYNADTSSNDFDFKGYICNFKTVLQNHSNKINQYKINYPNCNSCILFICDETNDYIQLTEHTILVSGNPSGEIRIHDFFMTELF